MERNYRSGGATRISAPIDRGEARRGRCEMVIPAPRSLRSASMELLSKALSAIKPSKARPSMSGATPTASKRWAGTRTIGPDCRIAEGRRKITPRASRPHDQKGPLSHIADRSISLHSFFSRCAGYHRRRNFLRPGAPEEMRRRAALKCRHGHQYDGRWGRRSHWRPLRGAVRLHGSCEP